MDTTDAAQTTVFFVLACTSWGLVEVPRYLFYALNLLNAVPYPLFWLRYRFAKHLCFIIFSLWNLIYKFEFFFNSLFAVLYPTGITGELGTMYHAFNFFITQAVSLTNFILYQTHKLIASSNVFAFSSAHPGPAFVQTDPPGVHRPRCHHVHPWYLSILLNARTLPKLTFVCYVHLF